MCLWYNPAQNLFLFVESGRMFIYGNIRIITIQYSSHISDMFLFIPIAVSMVHLLNLHMPNFFV